MRAGLLMSMALMPLAAGCGGAAEKAAAEAFDTNFTQSCVSSATGGGAPQAAAVELCGCALKGINAKFTTTEKLTASQEQLMPIVNQCLEQARQQ